MFRRVVITGNAQGAKRVLYRVRGARPVDQYRVVNSNFVSTGTNTMYNAVVFDDSVLLSVTSNLVTPYIFDLDVSENQPIAESIEEQSALGISAAVYNENGVLVCSNGVTSSGTASAPDIIAPGEMTSVPGEEPGEMAGETTDEPGAMI